jgi:hypothetical protein
MKVQLGSSTANAKLLPELYTFHATWGTLCIAEECANTYSLTLRHSEWTYALDAAVQQGRLM